MDKVQRDIRLLQEHLNKIKVVRGLKEEFPFHSIDSIYDAIIHMGVTEHQYKVEFKKHLSSVEGPNNETTI